MKRLQQMIQEHLNANDVSMSQFAEEAGIAHQTLSRILKTNEPALPRLDTLQALAHGMNVTIFAVVAAALDIEMPASINRTVLADEIEQLPNEQQQILLDFIRAFTAQSGNE